MPSLPPEPPDLLAEVLARRKELEDARSAAARIEGQLDALLARLWEEHGISSLKTAGKILLELERERTMLEQEFADGLAEFDAEHGEALGWTRKVG